jgi:hypothetical protein
LVKRVAMHSNNLKIFFILLISDIMEKISKKRISTRLFKLIKIKSDNFRPIDYRLYFQLKAESKGLNHD